METAGVEERQHEEQRNRSIEGCWEAWRVARRPRRPQWDGAKGRPALIGELPDSATNGEYGSSQCPR